MGYKNFPAFQKLASADVNEYLMDQSVMSFASIADGTAAVGTALATGMTFYDEANKQLAMYDGTIFRALPYAVQAGTATITLSAAASGSTTVNFTAGRFTQTPLVTISINGIPGGSSKLIPRASSASTASFTAYLYTGDAATTSSTVTVNWLAVQVTAGAAAG